MRHLSNPFWVKFVHEGSRENGPARVQQPPEVLVTGRSMTWQAQLEFKLQTFKPKPVQTLNVEVTLALMVKCVDDAR